MQISHRKEGFLFVPLNLKFAILKALVKDQLHTPAKATIRDRFCKP